MLRALISRSIFASDSSRLLGRAPVVRAAFSTTTRNGSAPSKLTQSVAPLAPLGVAAAHRAASDSSYVPRPKIFEEFALTDRVAIVSGGNGGIGLEMALTLCEAGARAVYCFDLPESPSAVWQTTRDFVAKMNNGSRLEYQSVDVTDQDRVCSAAARIGDQEKRLDVCVAAAGILRPNIDCLDTPGNIFKEVMDVNTTGVFFTAQAAGRQMRRFRTPGSIIIIASMSGTIQNRPTMVPYNTSKSAVLQMCRTMACELAGEGIRVNTISPGHIYTPLTATSLDTDPELMGRWSNLNPTKRLGRPDEIRGVLAFLASDASTYCTGTDILVDGDIMHGNSIGVGKQMMAA
ncbi:NAD(P)-binding protein [Hymenopellis radicata]|nr:NAD(P)-binding protein [Hymenopellis radicata]